MKLTPGGSASSQEESKNLESKRSELKNIGKILERLYKVAGHRIYPTNQLPMRSVLFRSESSAESNERARASGKRHFTDEIGGGRVRNLIMACKLITDKEINSPEEYRKNLEEVLENLKKVKSWLKDGYMNPVEDDPSVKRIPVKESGDDESTKPFVDYINAYIRKIENLLGEEKSEEEKIRDLLEGIKDVEFFLENIKKDEKNIYKKRIWINVLLRHLSDVDEDRLPENKKKQFILARNMVIKIGNDNEQNIEEERYNRNKSLGDQSLGSKDRRDILATLRQQNPYSTRIKNEDIKEFFKKFPTPERPQRDGPTLDEERRENRDYDEKQESSFRKILGHLNDKTDDFRIHEIIHDYEVNFQNPIVGKITAISERFVNIYKIGMKLHDAGSINIELGNIRHALGNKDGSGMKEMLKELERRTEELLKQIDAVKNEKKPTSEEIEKEVSKDIQATIAEVRRKSRWLRAFRT